MRGAGPHPDAGDERLPPGDRVAADEGGPAAHSGAAGGGTPGGGAGRGRARLLRAGADWIEWLSGSYVPLGVNHALLSFADPFTLQVWAGIEVEGLPELVAQVRLFGEEVLPRLS
jgi:hypothetical protein